VPNLYFLNAKEFISLNFATMKLSQVKTGTKVKIKSFENHEIILKLMEMGCLPDEEVTVWKKAPLGDPIYILVAGYSLSLRLDEAEQIFVDEIETSKT
jgi:ferrous iron transport protein A